MSLGEWPSARGSDAESRCARRWAMTALRPLMFAAQGLGLASAALALGLPNLFVVLAGLGAALWLAIGFSTW